MMKKKPYDLASPSGFRKSFPTFSVVMLSVLLLLAGASEARAESYFKDMMQAFARGGKNLAGAPLEIPLTIREYRDKEQTPIFTYYQGFMDGSLQALNRFVSGGWDIFAAFIPGLQEGIPPEPVTLF